VLFDLSREVNTALQQGAPIAESDLQVLDTFFATFAGDVLGIMPGAATPAGEDQSLEQGLMSLILSLRTETRKEKLWTLRIRSATGDSDRNHSRRQERGHHVERAPKG